MNFRSLFAILFTVLALGCSGDKSSEIMPHNPGGGGGGGGGGEKPLPGQREAKALTVAAFVQFEEFDRILKIAFLQATAETPDNPACPRVDYRSWKNPSTLIVKLQWGCDGGFRRDGVDTIELQFAENQTPSQQSLKEINVVSNTGSDYLSSEHDAYAFTYDFTLIRQSDDDSIFRFGDKNQLSVERIISHTNDAFHQLKFNLTIDSGELIFSNRSYVNYSFKDIKIQSQFKEEKQYKGGRKEINNSLLLEPLANVQYSLSNCGFLEGEFIARLTSPNKPLSGRISNSDGVIKNGLSKDTYQWSSCKNKAYEGTYNIYVLLNTLNSYKPAIK